MCIVDCLSRTKDNRGGREEKEWANFQNNFQPLIGRPFLNSENDLTILVGNWKLKIACGRQDAEITFQY